MPASKNILNDEIRAQLDFDVFLLLTGFSIAPITREKQRSVIFNKVITFEVLYF